MARREITMQEGDLYWEVPEYIKHERPRSWYIYAGIAFFFLVIFSIYGLAFWRLDTKEFNPLFLGIIVLGSFIMLMNDKSDPAMLPVIISDEGVQLGVDFYDYDEIRNFSILYKPRDEVKNLYFEFKGVTRPRLTIGLLDQDPIAVRDRLLRYIPEDLDRLHPPASEGLAKMLKL
jgi:hypothetical protein